MATSETFTQTAGQIIANALRDARIIPSEQPIQPVDFQNGLTALNVVIKHWQSQGIHLWSETEAILPLITGQRKYLLGPEGDKIAVASTFFNTTLSADIAALDTIIPLTAVSGLTTDGQSISISGAPDILTFNPASSTQDWTPNNATLTTLGTSLEIENTAALNGNAQYSLETDIGTTYQVDFTYTQDTSASAVFRMFDTTGTLATTTLFASGTASLSFTARDLSTTFECANGDAIIFATSLVDSLNYREKTAGDRIGIELDDGSRFWDHVVTVDSTTQVTINNGVPSTATSANSVYTYSTDIARPMRLLQARFGETLTASEIPVRQWSRDEYFDQPDKDSTGTVVNWYYTPELTRGELYVWQVANSINQVLRFTYIDPIEIPTALTDSLEFPSEWYMPLKWAVAAELGPSYGISQQRQIILEQKALTTLDNVLGFDVERESLSLQPDFR